MGDDTWLELLTRQLTARELASDVVVGKTKIEDIQSAVAVKEDDQLERFKASYIKDKQKNLLARPSLSNASSRGDNRGGSGRDRSSGSSSNGDRQRSHGGGGKLAKCHSCGKKEFSHVTKTCANKDCKKFRPTSGNGSSHSGNGSRPDAVQQAAQQSNPRRSGRLADQEKTCYTCSKKGHISPNCPEKGKHTAKSFAQEEEKNHCLQVCDTPQLVIPFSPNHLTEGSKRESIPLGQTDGVVSSPCGRSKPKFEEDEVWVDNYSEGILKVRVRMGASAGVPDVIFAVDTCSTICLVKKNLCGDVLDDDVPDYAQKWISKIQGESSVDVKCMAGVTKFNEVVMARLGHGKLFAFPATASQLPRGCDGLIGLKGIRHLMIDVNKIVYADHTLRLENARYPVPPSSPLEVAFAESSFVDEDLLHCTTVEDIGVEEQSVPQHASDERGHFMQILPDDTGPDGLMVITTLEKREACYLSEVKMREFLVKFPDGNLTSKEVGLPDIDFAPSAPEEFRGQFKKLFEKHMSRCSRRVTDCPSCARRLRIAFH